MTREQAAEYIKEQSPEAFLPKAKKRGYVCPLCGNGTGANGDGIVKNPRDGRYYCFKCGEVKGDIFDLIGAAFGLEDFNSRFDKAAEIYGVTVDEFAPIKKARGKNGNASNVGNASNAGKKETAHRGIVSGDVSENINKAVFSVIDGRLSVTVPRSNYMNNSQNNSENNAESTTPLSPAVTDGYIEKCHGNVSMTDYFEGRGIGNELVNKFRLGFDPAFPIGGGQTRAAVILPTEAGSFEARFIDPLPDSKAGARYRKQGRTAIFNVSALRFGVNGINSASAANVTNDTNAINGTNSGNAINGADSEAPGKPVFVCEGIFDALSVMECGGEAVALGSAANWRLLVSEIEKHGAAVPLVLLLDNDETGKNAAAKLSEALRLAGVSHIDGSEAIGSKGGFTDPNARLRVDRAGLAAAIARLEGRCAPLSEDISAEKTHEYDEVNAAACLAAFRVQIEKSVRLPVCGTGFAALDKAVNGGLYPGLYVLGAASSVGKTTFLLQIADHAAAAGRQVMFFSLEQSRFELMSKSVSRESFMYCRENHLGVSSALSSLDISDGGRHGGFDNKKLLAMENAFALYEKYAGNLFLYEGKGGMSPEDIAVEVRKFYAFTRPATPPLIVVDYIQILSPGGGKMSDKQAMDRSITALKQLSRDYEIPLLAVSSFNRMSYSQPVSMEAFKESGAIEYGADILAGLQPRGVGSTGFDITAAKAKDPRELELVILKNRSGAIPAEPVRFTYFPKFNCFVEADK